MIKGWATVVYNQSGNVGMVKYEWDDRSFSDIEDDARALTKNEGVTLVQIYRVHYAAGAENGRLEMIGGPAVEFR